MLVMKLDKEAVIMALRFSQTGQRRGSLSSLVGVGRIEYMMIEKCRVSKGERSLVDVAGKGQNNRDRLSGMDPSFCAKEEGGNGVRGLRWGLLRQQSSCPSPARFACLEICSIVHKSAPEDLSASFLGIV
jgi:hypothetical protein